MIRNFNDQQARTSFTSGANHTAMSTSEAIYQFALAARMSGLIIDGSPIADGKWHRSAVEGDKKGQKSGSYCLNVGASHRGVAENFKNPSLSIIWHSKSRSEISDADRASLQAEIERQKQAELSEKMRVAGVVQGVLSRLPKAGNDHAYLMRKGIGAHGLLRSGSNLIVPLRDVSGVVWSMQSIGLDGVKQNFKGGRKSGCFHLIGDDRSLQDAQFIAIAEGYATAASIFEATGWPVAVAVDSGNLLSVAIALHAHYGNAKIVLCGDDDRFAKCGIAWASDGTYIRGREISNSGREHAERAAEVVGGIAIFPEFRGDDWSGTDFNDAAVTGVSIDDVLLSSANRASNKLKMR